LNEFGLPPNLGGFGRLPEPVPRPAPKPPERPSRSVFNTFPLLVTVCLALGAVLSWGLSQQRERARLTARNYHLDQAYTVIISQRDDLAHLVSDPRVQMIQLAGRGPAANRSATIAWNAERKTGFVLAEQMPLLPPGEVYRVWRATGGTDAIPTDRTFRADAGLTCVEFHLTVTADSPAPGAGASERFIIIASSEADAGTSRPSGQIVYETETSTPRSSDSSSAHSVR